jgi:hypothetical protein
LLYRCNSTRFVRRPTSEGMLEIKLVSGNNRDTTNKQRTSVRM